MDVMVGIWLKDCLLFRECCLLSICHDASLFQNRKLPIILLYSDLNMVSAPQTHVLVHTCMQRFAYGPSSFYTMVFLGPNSCD